MKLNEILEKQNIEYEVGLSEDEILEVEQIYDIQFPPELKRIYMNILPIGKGFYKWRDISKQNVEFINKVMKLPFDDIEKDIDYIDWCDDWGAKPEESRVMEEVIRNKLNSAPKLIPIYLHRYIASGNVDKTPIFSVHGPDIIYYGEDLEQYFQIEFGYKKYQDIDFNRIQAVPFWSEIL